MAVLPLAPFSSPSRALIPRTDRRQDKGDPDEILHCIRALGLPEIAGVLCGAEPGVELFDALTSRWHLHGDVSTDYAVLSFAARAEGTHELESLLAGLRQGRGEAFSGVHYSWLAFAREARTCRMLVTSMARRAADLATSAGRPEQAEEALVMGLRLTPTSEPLWRDALGAHLRERRRARGETLQETADRAGISLQYLSEIERGVKDPSSEMISAVAGALDEDLAVLTLEVARSLHARTPAPAARRHDALALAA